MIILCRKCDVMMRIETNQSAKKSNAQLMLNTAAGTVAGMGARYLVPTKAEMSSLKNHADTFFSAAATNARGANRSMLKYGAVGAIAAATVCLLSKLLTNKTDEKKYDDTFEYSKYQALIESPDIAAEFFLYGD